MKRILLIFCLVCMGTILFGQELVLTKKKNGKEKIIKQGKKIKVWTNSGEVHKGFYTLKNDSLVILDKGTISINDIEMISKKSTGVKIAGGTLTGIVGLTTIGISIAAIQILSDGGRFTG